MSTLRVYRIVVDSWPTPDGQPWERCYGPKYQHYDHMNGHSGADDVPEWVREVITRAHYPSEPEGWRVLKRCDDIPEDATGASVSVVMPKPVRKNFLSASGAHELARDMRAFGAQVRVLRSEPVVWAEEP